MLQGGFLLVSANLPQSREGVHDQTKPISAGGWTVSNKDPKSSITSSPKLAVNSGIYTAQCVYLYLPRSVADGL